MTSSLGSPSRLAAPLLTIALACTIPSVAWAQGATEADDVRVRDEGRTSDEHLSNGDYYFKTGYYLRASEEYRCAVLEDAHDPARKLAFGHALFAIRNYSYSAYMLRRGVSFLRDPADFRPDVISLFPSPRSFRSALRDLKRYVTDYPRDPSGLSVLAYMYYCTEELDRAQQMFEILQHLDPDDSYAAFFLDLLARRATEQPAPQAAPEPAPAGDDTMPDSPEFGARPAQSDGSEPDPEPVEPAPPAPAPADEPAPPAEPEAPEGVRTEERPTISEEELRDALSRD